MEKEVQKKILPKYFRAVLCGEKHFELRKDEDNVQAGDILLLREWDNGHYTGREISKKVTYVLRKCSEYGLKEGYCIISW